ncbi:tyrosyl-DNA phosphodiesterase 1-like isoform X2 [Scylla paramamosain]|uniref:tyrosyl-DNA phosphodiesterase 1-like isoform X2 n=1 Tax=Scylla paramamosain TaxID=85552 RepID=UPI0030830AA1
MAYKSDEEMARRLQREFDEEARRAEEAEDSAAEWSLLMPHSSHKMSDSSEEEEMMKIRGRGGRSDVSFSPCDSRPGPSHKSPQGPQRQEDGQAGTSGAKPPCRYGSSCYRKNPQHHLEFSHPTEGDEEDEDDEDEGSEDEEDGEGRESRKRKGEEETQAKKKRRTMQRPSKPFIDRLADSQPFGLFLNKCYSVEGTYNDSSCLVLNDLLNPALGKLVESAQLTFLVDLKFLMEVYESANVADKPLLLVYGEICPTKKIYRNITFYKVPVRYRYGRHHTKAMFFLYETGMRIVIHTSNLLSNDCFEKTQGYWVSPVFPKIENGEAGISQGESPTGFKRDLLEYLDAYQSTHLQHWVDLVEMHDFSECRAVLVASVPGYHTKEMKDEWGHIKIKRILSEHLDPSLESVEEQPYSIVQCSSIGSLGKDAKEWLGKELHHSLSGGYTDTDANPKICVVYPNEEDVRNSSEGWEGGSCLPYRSDVDNKQRWLRRYMRCWRSEGRQRSRSMPHIKTYTQVTPDHKHAYYFMLTSANLSKAAWGVLQKKGDQLFIRAFELGVLLLPKFVTGGTKFRLPLSGDPDITLPYDLPLTPYSPNTRPWLSDLEKKKRDVMGNTYKAPQ